ncbi:hypothetical protein D5086_001877 [Populus alba]|uniref:Uncharacterized protein n=1 Tax=Populus alba TaxID=43335 RepID=A0ACC4D155_POPAL
MTKSKTKTSFLKTVQGDFSLQIPRYGSVSRATKVSSKHRNKLMQRNSSSHSSTAPSACFSDPTRGPSSISPSQPTSGKECFASQPSSGAPPTDDGHTLAFRAQGTPFSGGYKCFTSEIQTGSLMPGY